jgi:3-oxoacyl-[acyl-carrier protein] reductase
MELRFADRIIVVTGAAGGIGTALCKRFCRSGGKVLAVDLDPQGLARLKEELAAEELTVECRCGDLTSENDVRIIFESILAEHANVHVLVNNAGMTTCLSSWKGVTPDAWNRVVEANLRTAFLCTRAVLNSMIRQRYGRIVNLSSVTSLTDTEDSFTELSYVAAKGGINSFTRGLARQVGRHGITVNAILPGFVRTPLTEGLLDSEAGEEIVESWISRCPRRRLGVPEDVASLAAFLASDQADFINAQLICVDGGFA